MVVVAAGTGAGVEFHTLVRGAFFADVLVAVEAHVHRLGHAVGAGDLRLVLDVAADAQACVDLFQPVGVARIGKLAARMRVMRLFAIGAVAIDTRLLQHLTAAQWAGVADIAFVGKLVMAVAQGAGHVQGLVFAFEQYPGETGTDQYGEQQPGDPVRTVVGLRGHLSTSSSSVHARPTAPGPARTVRCATTRPACANVAQHRDRVCGSGRSTGRRCRR